MSNASEISGKAGWRSAIDGFLQDRLEAKLEKLKPDDPKREELAVAYEHTVWLEDAARRVQQIQAVTHSLKPIHPDARGTNLYVEPAALPALQEVGSHALGQHFTTDVVGNAAALDVYKLLKLEVKGQSLLSALQAADTEAVQALGDDPATAQQLRDAFVSLTEARSEGPSSHTRAKQLYWLVGEDASDDAQYELLAPLYATSLAHAVHATIQEHRFGEANKAARQARKERKHHDGVYCEYRDLAVQKLGGTKPQNISQLNSERGGVNYLLSSLPPVWTASSQRLPVNAESVFARLFGARPDVLRTLKALRDFLAKDPEPNLETRQRRDALVDKLIDELVALAGELQQMQPGWTRDDDRFAQLHRAEQLWLDPLRAELPEEDDFTQEWLALEWPAEIGKRFGRWLNQQLQNRLPVGDVEARAWAKELLADEDGFREHLRTLRRRLSKREVAA